MSGRVHDVAVIGLGPVGGVLGHLLGLCGLDTLIVEKAPEIYDLPRAVHFDDEVMRVFQTIGVAEDVAAVSRINPGMRFVDAAGRLLLDWPRPQEVGPQGWHPSYRFHQPDLERILRRALVARPTVMVQTGRELVALTVGDGVVALILRDADGGISEARARYVVGCDGARSFVRQKITDGVEDLGFHERWLVADVLLKRPRPDLGDHTIQHCDPSHPTTYVRGPGNRRRWEIALAGDVNSDRAAEPETVWCHLKDWITPEDAELERAAVYTFHSVLSDKWRKGRLLIAGDAAHQTPPFMGQGLCTGVRDAANLAWKLALCVKGRAPDALLDSYQAERYPHAREYIATAVRLGRLLNASGTQEALRAAFRQPDGTARMSSIAPRLGPGLGSPDARGHGRLFAQPRLADGRLMDALIGYAPALVVDAGLWRAAGDAADAARSSGIVAITTEDAPGAADHLQAVGVRAIMLRPDRYVLGSADDPAGLAELIAGTALMDLRPHPS